MVSVGLDDTVSRLDGVGGAGKAYSEAFVPAIDSRAKAFEVLEELAGWLAGFPFLDEELDGCLKDGTRWACLDGADIEFDCVGLRNRGG